MPGHSNERWRARQRQTRPFAASTAARLHTECGKITDAKDTPVDIHNSIEAAIRTYQKGLDTQSPFVLEHERYAPSIPDKIDAEEVDGWFIYRNGRGAYLRMTHIRRSHHVASQPVVVTAEVWSKDIGWVHVAGEVVPFHDNDLPEDSAANLANLATQLFRLGCNFADLQVHR